MKELRPVYYRDRRGHDLFWRMEHGYYSQEWCEGFCQLNIQKYKMRRGEKTSDPSVDDQKIKTYEAELKRLREIYGKE